MWKITRLYLKNFIHIYAGMNKREIELDLSKCDKKINIFIGKMGSGKSSILGHLQPFSTYGTLDIRNQEALIIPGEDGLKEIEFVHNKNVYSIQHKYTWNKSSNNHSTKSFIQLNGRELNENGNVRTFKEIIRTEFGIDQNFLRLLRLGPNVSNLINMKSTERKSFIASLLKDTEVYATIYQKLTEDYRNLNSTLTVLSNKLVGLLSDKEEEFKIEKEDLEDILIKIQKESDAIKDEISKLKGMNKILADNNSEEELVILADSTTNNIKEMESSLLEINKLLDELPSINLKDVSIEFGEVSGKINSIHEDILSLQNKYSENQNSRNKIKELILIQDNENQIYEMKKKAEEIKNRYEKNMNLLKSFSCNYSYSYLVGLPNVIENFQMTLEEMVINKKEVIGKIYNSDGTLIPWAKKKLQILQASEINYRNLLSNINFSSEYVSPFPLYVPPGCPTNTCPFIQTHPEIIKNTSKDKRNKSIIELKDKIDKIEVEIAIHEDYISQYPKMQILKKMWQSISSVLDSLGILKEKNLYKILTSLDARCNWYDHSILLDITEKEKMKEDFAQLQNEYFKIENEIMSLENTDIQRKKNELKILETEAENIISTLENKQKEYEELSKKKEKLETILLTLKNVDFYNSEKTKLESDINTANERLQDLKSRISKVSTNIHNIQILEGQLASVNIEYKNHSYRLSQLNVVLHDIASTKSSYEEILTERNEIKLILDAVSSKEGIPLILVKVFLEDCKEIINELIADVFDDDLEIISFDISENSNEFKIPYRINGTDVPDIELASQGQSAIISIAMSFALCRKSMFDYNIMLLDEIDNSIYKSDRETFIMILSKQMRALDTEQVFMITHNDIFQQSGLPVNIIMTTPEVVDIYPNQSKIELY